MMKKFLTLVLALVMVLALAAPAMAFTSKTVADDELPELDIYLVEYEDDDFFGIVGLPESDRGYAKNEIVAAVAELYVPEDFDLTTDYSGLEISGDNVSLDVTDNKWGVAVPAAGLTAATDTLWLAAGTRVLTGLNPVGDDATYKWLFFAKVTDDDASLTFTLISSDVALDLDATTPVAAMAMGDYYVAYAASEFTVSEIDTAGTGAGQALFIIQVDDDFESTGLKIVYDTDTDVEYTVAAGAKGLLFIDASGVEDDEDIIEDLMEIYEDVFVDEFGFDFDLLGGVVDGDTFNDYNGASDLEATVEIAPWTAYVTVPDNIVVDPPKTGDAASILGFVMIVLAAAAVVAARKVRA